MKLKKLSILLMVGLAGCSVLNSSKKEIPTIESQTFKTNVPGETIKITKSCGWLWNSKDCKIESIEAVGVQPSVGGTSLMQKAVTMQACDNARANIVSYVFGESVTDSRYSRARSKQSENQKDDIKSKNEKIESELSPEDRESVLSIRQALTNSDIEMVRTVTVNAQGRLVGFKIKNTTLVNGKIIACTIDWIKTESEELKNIRGLISGT